MPRTKPDTKTAHTPGPWERGSGARIISRQGTEILRSGRRVWKRVATAMGESIAEIEANARLIAAAPDLLEALREWIDAEDTWDGDFADDDRVARAKEAARAAIAKAEGH